jgi:hypothetical protein
MTLWLIDTEVSGQLTSGLAAFLRIFKALVEIRFASKSQLVYLQLTRADVSAYIRLRYRCE